MERGFSLNEYQNYVSTRLIPFPDEQRLTPLGEWINNFLIQRELTLVEAVSVFNLCSIDEVRKRPVNELSTYTFVNILLGAGKSNCTIPEIDSIADIIGDAFEEKNRNKKSLTYKVPPTTQKSLLGNTHTTDLGLVKGIYGVDLDRVSLNELRNRIRNLRTKLGIESPFTLEQAGQIAQIMNPEKPVHL